MNEQTKSWPAHYNAADIEVIERIPGWIRGKSYNQAALARLARVSESTLSQIMRGLYVSSPTGMLAKVRQAMENLDEAKGGGGVVVETSVFQLVTAACTMARRNKNFSVVSAYVGTGKTFGAKHYAAHHPNTYLIEASPTMGKRDLVVILGSLLASWEGRGSTNARFLAAVEAVKGSDTLLIVDEAETLSPECLHTLRRLRDLAGIGIVLTGTEKLTAIMKPEHGQFDQIRSRTGFWPATVTTLKPEDGAALVQAGFPGEDVSEEVIARLIAYSKGSARMLAEGLVPGIHACRNGGPLNVRLVDAVATQALCLAQLPVVRAL